MEQEQNRDFWDNRAERHSGHHVSWWDINMKKIEINTISSLILSSDYVLDVGCSNGSSTIEIQKNTGARFLGIDYSIKSIEQARKHESSNLKFLYADILNLQQISIFDKAISIRCIINLMDWTSQLEAIKKIHTALKPNGVYIMCEAFTNAFINLNRLREFMSLPSLKVPEQNRYMSEVLVESELKGLFEIEKVIRHSSLYYIGTRVFQYLCMDEEPNGYDTDIHKFFGNYGYETQNCGDFGPNKVYVLRKI